MLARHAFSLLAVVLAACPARARDDPFIQTHDVFGGAAAAWLAVDNVQEDVEELSSGHFCPLRLIGRYRCWYFQVDALVLFRTGGHERPLAIFVDSLETALDASDLNPAVWPGQRLMIGHRLSADHGWELSYLGLYEWSTSAAAVDRNNLDIGGTLRGIAEDYSDADRIAISSVASLHNAEANCIFDGATWSAIAGLRYLHLNDAIVVTATDADSGRSNYTVRSQTDLIGPQFGIRTGRVNNHWTWELTMKAGLYGSVMRQQQRLWDNNNTFLRRDSSAWDGSTTLLGDVNLSCFRQLNNVWSIRGGYYLMYAAEVAPALEQLNFDNLAISNHSVVRGDLIVHGAALGLEARW